MKVALANPAAEKNSPILPHQVRGVNLVNQRSLEENFCQHEVPQSLEVYRVCRNALLAIRVEQHPNG